MLVIPTTVVKRFGRVSNNPKLFVSHECSDKSFFTFGLKHFVRTLFKNKKILFFLHEILVSFWRTSINVPVLFFLFFFFLGRDMLSVVLI